MNQQYQPFNNISGQEYPIAFNLEDSSNVNVPNLSIYNNQGNNNYGNQNTIP